MIRVSFSVASLLLGSGLVLLANGMLTTAVSLVAKREGFSATAMALVFAAYNAGLVCGSIFNGRLIRRFGHIRVFAGVAALVSCTTMVLGLWREAPLWFVLRFVVGMGLSGLFMVLESWLNERASAATRGAVLAAYMIIVQCALGAGQFLLASLDLSKSAMFSLFAGLYSLSLVPIAFTQIPQPSVEKISRMGIRALFSLSPLGVFGCFVAGLVTSSLFALGPLFLVGLRFPMHQSTWFMGAVLFGGLFAQWPVGWLSDRLGRGPVMAGCCGALVACCAVVWLLPLSLWVMLAFGACLGGLGFVIYPLAVAWVNDLVAPEDLVPVSGTLLVIYGAGSVLGPMAATWSTARVGPFGLLAWLALVACVCALVVVYRLARHRPVPIEEQGDFVPVSLPQALPAVQLDPRLEPDQLAFDFVTQPTREVEGAPHI